MTRRRSILSTPWWGRQRHRGGPRSVARSGGSLAEGFIVGIKSLWAIPAKRAHHGRARKRTVKGRR